MRNILRLLLPGRGTRSTTVLEPTDVESAAPRYVIGGDVSEEPSRFTLPSRYDGLTFDMTAIIRFRAEEDAPVNPDPMSIAVASIRDRAMEISRHLSLGDVDRLRTDLAVELGVTRYTKDPRIIAMAKQIVVGANDEEVKLVRDYERSRALDPIGDWRRRQHEREADRIAELLTDPRRATAWWMATSSSTDLGEAEEMSRTFVRIAGILSTVEQPSQQIAELLLDPRQASAWWLNACGLTELADMEKITDTFGRIASALAPSPAADDDRRELIDAARAVSTLWEGMDEPSRHGFRDTLVRFAELQKREDVADDLRKTDV